ncbi:MAG: hypothetical protein U0837_00225 [Dehalococcoidia bacterium]
MGAHPGEAPGKPRALLELVRQHTLLIKAYDGEVNRLAEKEYPESGVCDRSMEWEH